MIFIKSPLFPLLPEASGPPQSVVHPTEAAAEGGALQVNHLSQTNLF